MGYNSTVRKDKVVQFVDEYNDESKGEWQTQNGLTLMGNMKKKQIWGINKKALEMKQESWRLVGNFPLKVGGVRISHRKDHYSNNKEKWSLWLGSRC